MDAAPAAPTIALYLGVLLSVSLAGSVLPLLRAWSQASLCLVVSFCAGILLGATFFHMLPEVAPTLPNFGAPVLGGFLLLYILERFLLSHTCEEAGCDYHHLGATAFAGIVFHDLIEGFSLGASLSYPAVSLPVFAAIAVHKIPSTFSLTGILLLGKYRKPRIVLLSVLLACMTPAGVLAALLVLRGLSATAVAVALSIAAGTFLAIATSDLLPHVHGQHEGRLKNLAALVVGIVLMYSGSLLPGR
jgi:zinc and cadmium transporter